MRSEDGVMVATMEHPSAREMAFGGEIELRFPFSQQLVDALKQEIPGRYRRWDADDRVWRVMGVFAETAIDLLVEHYPNAELPGDRVTVVQKRKEALPPPTLDDALADLVPAPISEVPQIAPILAGIVCPKCHECHEMPVRPVVHTGETVARRELVTPELLVICIKCRVTLVVAFYPAPESERMAS